MASKAKPTGTRHTTSRAKKPATIDLDAKEVAKDVKTEAKSAVKPDPSSKAQSFGRPQTSEKSDSAKTSVPKTASTKDESKKPETDTLKKSETKKTEDKPTPKSSSSKPQPAKSAPAKPSGSFFGKLSSAFMGGVAALVGFGAIGLWDGARELPIIGNFYGGSQSASIQSTELDALKAEIATLKESNTSNGVDLSPINEKLTSLENSISEIKETSGTSNALNEKITSLEQGFAAVNTSIAEITASAADGSNTSPVALSTAISSLDKRLETLEADLGTVADSVSKNPALDAVSNSISSLETQVQKISKSVTNLQQSADANAQTLSGLSAQSETLESTVASVKASEKVAKSVAVNALATALENDDALSLPIASVKALIGETPETNRLEELNANGIASRNELTSNLGKIINSVQNPNTPPKEGSISDRFWANAQNLVSFRTSGPQEGDTPLAILSRVKAKVEADEVTAAKAEWETLPQDIRDNGATWLSQLNSRIEAFGLHQALNQKLTAEAG